MSVKMMGLVWDCDIPRDLKFILLAYADHADHEGKNVYPAVSTIMQKTGYSERSVQRITRELVNLGYLEDDGIGPHGTNRWAMGVPKLRGAKMAPVQNATQKGVQNATKRGAKMTPEFKDLTVIKNKPSLKTGAPTGAPSLQATPELIDIRYHMRTAYNIDLPDALDTPEFHDAWMEWEEYRREKRKKLTALSVSKQVKLLEQYAAQAPAIIETSIMNGWQGLFAPKSAQANGNGYHKQSVYDKNVAAYQKILSELEET